MKRDKPSAPKEKYPAAHRCSSALERIVLHSCHESGTGSEPALPNKSGNEEAATPNRLTIHRTAVVLAIVSGAANMIYARGPSIRCQRLALFDFAVVADGTHAGGVAGVFATVIGILILDCSWLARASLSC
jgi:hypothetical protein